MTLEEITTQMRARVAAKGGIKGKTIKFNFGEDGCVRIVGSSDPAAARACAGTLPAEGRMMFEAAAAKVKPGSNLRDVLMSEVRGLVMSGKLSRDIAQKNGPAVGECLKKLQS